MESVKVPQHLDLEDVIAWGLGATDLLCAVAGAAMGWWLYLAIPGGLAVRVVAAALAVVLGVSFGVVRLGDVSLRDWLATAAAYAIRPRLLVTGGGS
ncbi:MAG: PrgI family mobile element protein [Thermoplasmata archaeon]